MRCVMSSSDVMVPRWSSTDSRSVRQNRSIFPRAGASYGRACKSDIWSLAQQRRSASPRYVEPLSK
jgi:hypothetical protein